MFEKLARALRVIESHERVLLAVSGGRDSFSMLKWFALQSKWQTRCVVAHVHHGIRADADDAARLVREQAEKYGMEFDLAYANVVEHLCANKDSIEAAARRFRYAALEEMRQRHGCAWILTAHTLEDSAETVFMKLRQECSWFEATGIPEKRGNILRPFLEVRRHELRQLIDDDDPVDDDPMNLDPAFLRVSARKAIERISNTLPDIARRLVRHGTNTRSLLFMTTVLANHMFPNKLQVAGSGDHRIEILPKNLYLEDLGFVFVETALRKLQGNREFRLSASERRQVNEFLAGSTSRSVLCLKQGFELSKAGRHYWLSAGNCHDEDEVRNAHDLLDRTLLVPCAIGDRATGELFLDRSSLSGKFRARAWSAGEKFRPAKRRTRKVSDWLRDIGVHPSCRRQWPVLADDSGIVAIPGLGVSESTTAVPHSSDILAIHWESETLSHA